MIEKAYAKLHGSYAALESGWTADGFVDLTGGISERIQFSDADKYSHRGGLWGIIGECHREGWLAACSATGGREADNGMGILTGHAYSIINARELLVNGQPEYLLQIRNPWGQKEWTGTPMSEISYFFRPLE